MKPLFKIFIIAIFPFLFVGCQDDDEPTQTYISLGEIENNYNNTGETVVLLDNGKTLIPSNTIPRFSDEERVAVNYSFNESEGEADEFEANVYLVEDVLTKDVVPLTSDNMEELGNDPTHVCEDDIWISGGYLNIFFEYYGSGHVSHFINMTTNEDNKYDENGRLILTFKHNAYQDAIIYLYPGLVSFDMESLQEDEEESIDFVVRVLNYDGDVFEWEDTYEFGATTNSINKINEIPNSYNLN